MLAKLDADIQFFASLKKKMIQKEHETKCRCLDVLGGIKYIYLNCQCRLVDVMAKVTAAFGGASPPIKAVADMFLSIII